MKQHKPGLIGCLLLALAICVGCDQPAEREDEAIYENGQLVYPRELLPSGPATVEAP